MKDGANYSVTTTNNEIPVITSKDIDQFQDEFAMYIHKQIEDGNQYCLSEILSEILSEALNDANH